MSDNTTEFTKDNIDSVIENVGKNSASKVSVRETLEMLKNRQRAEKQKTEKERNER